MKAYLKCQKIDTAISRAKKSLTQKAKKKGLYENFGQDEVQEIEDVFIDNSSYTDRMNKNRDKLQGFNNWCMNFNDNSF